jgi:hypothetical protein|tara:strand:+ start:682 stop:1041 length:360 start_codon:yes stop_codon:yes gene_type:complete
MLTKKVLDTTRTSLTGELFEFDLGDTSGIISYDLSGGSADQSRIVKLYGRIPGDNVTATDAADVTSAWVQIYIDDGLDTGDTGGQVILLYPSVKAYITGNSNTARIRVWVAYREGLGCS